MHHSLLSGGGGGDGPPGVVCEGLHYTFHFEVLCDGRQCGVVPDSVQRAVSQDDLPGGVAGLDRRL